MNRFNLKLSFFLLFLCFYFISSAQKKVTVTVHWPSALATKSLEITYGDNSDWTTIKPVMDKTGITISNLVISKFLIINLTIDGVVYNFPFENLYYVIDEPRDIILYPQLEPTRTGLNKFELTKVYEVSDINKEFQLFIKKEENKRIKYLALNGIDSIYFSIYNELILKKLAFITQHKNTYFAFRIFTDEICPISFNRQDSVLDGLMAFYETTFPKEVKLSLEGCEVVKMLHEKFPSMHLNIAASALTAKEGLKQDIHCEEL